MVLIPKRKCLVGPGLIWCEESGTPSTIIYTQQSSQHEGHGYDTPMMTKEWMIKFNGLALTLSDKIVWIYTLVTIQ